MRLAAVGRVLAGAEPLDLVVRLTLLILLLRPGRDWRVAPALLLAAGSALVWPRLQRQPALWGALALLTAARIWIDWPLSDNHAYLLAYWCLALGLALATAEPARALAPTARLLLGLVFACAVLWKLALSRDYADGTFFAVTLLEDPRFGGFTRLVAGLGPDLLERAREALGQHVDGTIALVPVPALPARFWLVARGLTLWTVGLEALVALAFLWPAPVAGAATRNALLLVFCISTFAVAPVAGFGWLLVTLGLAQCRPERAATRAAYLGAFALILLYEDVPWSRLLVP